MIAFITGMGWITPAGMGCGRELVKTADIPKLQSAMCDPNAALPSLTGKAVFGKAYRQFGRMDAYSKLGLAAIAFALRDAGMDQWTEKREIGMIGATRYGCLHTDADYFDTLIPEGGLQASPNLFAYTLPNCFLGEAAICFGLTGSDFMISETAPSGLTSLCMALESIACGESEKMLCGVCDLERPTLISEEDQAWRGAVFFLLERDADRDVSSYGELDLTRSGQILFNGGKADDLMAVVLGCLAGM